MRKMSYPEVAFEVISTFVKSDEVPTAELRKIINNSFETFRTTGTPQ
jgi:threonine synthase